MTKEYEKDYWDKVGMIAPLGAFLLLAFTVLIHIPLGILYVVPWLNSLQFGSPQHMLIHFSFFFGPIAVTVMTFLGFIVYGSYKHHPKAYRSSK